jgi:uncharacterized protein
MFEAIPPHISLFLEKQTCASVCCVDEQGHPYCFSCFYVFNSGDGILFFKSSVSARHSSLLIKNSVVAGTVLPDKLNTLQVKGIQFEGELLPADHLLARKAAASYYKRNPATVMIPGEIWTIRVNHIKFTDNTLGFGTKISWQREEQELNHQQKPQLV